MKTNATTPQKRKTQSEVHLARGRLRGVLNDSLHGDMDDTDSQSTTGTVEDLPHRGRPAKNLQLQSPRTLRHSTVTSSGGADNVSPSKRRRREQLQVGAYQPLNQHQHQTQKIQAESFVMKLFDRSLDLSKYTEQTPLYPICRAWMANQPRNPNIRSYRDQRSPSPVLREKNGEEVLQQLQRKEMREVSTLPAPQDIEISKLPIPLPAELEEETIVTGQNKKSTDVASLDKIGEGVDSEQLRVCREELLANHQRKWKQVKTNWLQHMKHYQKRYEINHLILQELFKP